MNLVLWGKGSSAAIPFSTLVALLALWFGVSVPLTFIGAYFGFRKRVSLLSLVLQVGLSYYFINIFLGIPHCSLFSVNGLCNGAIFLSKNF